MIDNIIKPVLRAIKYDTMHYVAKFRVWLKKDATILNNVAFIVGCGNSGTTIFGEVLDKHDQVSYFFEPYHLWSVVEPKLDLTNLFEKNEAWFIATEEDYQDRARNRFCKLFYNEASTNLIVEKTPHNAVRIEYLEQLNLNNKYIYLIRNGLDVAASINYRSETNTYKIAGRKNYNQWWGVNNSKWEAILRDIEKYNYDWMEYEEIQTDQEKAAIEWLITNLEVEKRTPKLGKRLLNIRYEDLVDTPEEVITNMLDFLSLSIDKEWVHNISRMIKNPKKRDNELTLPPKIANEFNRIQKKYGYNEFAKIKN